MPKFIDLTGQKLGRWTVLYRDGTHRFGGAQWRCRCECGAEKTIRAQPLRNGESRSCGCLNIDVHREVCIERNTTHGQASRYGKSRTYTIWSNMISRCSNKNSTGYKKYGARGTTVCKRWRKFENFLSDMGECPSRRHTIDRIKNSKGYEPGNCRWATMQQQQNNRTNNRRITYNGTTRTLAQWSDHTGISRETIARRLDMGWPTEKALTIKPVRGANRVFNRYPKPRRNSRFLTFQGETMSLADWSRKTGIHRKTITSRMDNQGWSVDRALTTSPRS